MDQQRAEPAGGRKILSGEPPGGRPGTGRGEPSGAGGSVQAIEHDRNQTASAAAPQALSALVPPATMATMDAAELVRKQHELRFSALRNAFYHSARLRHFEWQHRSLMFGIVVTGTAGVSTVLSGWLGGATLSAMTALLAALDLVLDLRGKAQTHDSLKRRYYLLLAAIEADDAANDGELRKAAGEILRITADEPVTYRAVDAAAHNEAIDTMGLDPGEKQVLSLPQRLFRHFYTAQGVEFPYSRDVAR